MVRKRVVAIEALGEAGPGEGGFLTLIRLRYRNRYEDGTHSRPYLYEHIHRRGFDSVAIALYHEPPGGLCMAYRHGIRVPVYFRRELPLPIEDPRGYLFVPEAVAGSLEPGDRGREGLLARVVAEVYEEAGFRVRPEEVEPLGGGFFPSHGQSSEKIHLCAVRVDPSAAEPPPGDGSVNEADAPPVLFRPVREILLDCAAGRIEDPKVELLAWRLCILKGYFPVQGRHSLPEEAAALLEFRRSQEVGGWGGPPNPVDSGR
jgi:ADP-ribose pyrophosphatase